MATKRKANSEQLTVDSEDEKKIYVSTKYLEKLLAIPCCHITGSHDPEHLGKYVCFDQKAAAYDRIVATLELNPDGLKDLATFHPVDDCYWCGREKEKVAG